MRAKNVAYLLAAVAFLLGPADAFAWWSTGHEHITDGAISHLTGPLGGFFDMYDATLEQASGVEPPGMHYIDIDNYDEWSDPDSFPRDRQALINKYGSQFVHNNGEGPWTAGNLAQELTSRMSTAQTETDWINLLGTAGALAHYVEDLHNPLHLTANYNGQYTDNYGIHARYEGYMTSYSLSELSIASSPDQCTYSADVVDTIFDGIALHYPYVADIMDADTEAVAIDPSYGYDYYQSLWDDTGSFTHGLFQDASEAVASVWYTAWIDAGSPTPIPEPATSLLLMIGAVGLSRRRRNKARSS